MTSAVRTEAACLSDAHRTALVRAMGEDYVISREAFGRFVDDYRAADDPAAVRQGYLTWLRSLELAERTGGAK